MSSMQLTLVDRTSGSPPDRIHSCERQGTFGIQVNMVPSDGIIGANTVHCVLRKSITLCLTFQLENERKALPLPEIRILSV
jgi:hypothetical protein